MLLITLNGELANGTSEILLVYGPNPEPIDLPGRRDNKLYRLKPGYKTPADWDCDGLYVPSNRFVKQFALPNKKGPIAVKYIDLQSPNITMENEQTYYCPFNFSLLYPNEVNWLIPDLSYEEIVLDNYDDVPNAMPVD